MLKTNIGNILKIATVPSGANDTAKTFTELKYITELKTDISYKKEDRNYLHNKGNTTSITTGKTTSLSVTIDLDDSDTLHKYLLKLSSLDPIDVNNQYIQLVLNSSHEASKVYQIAGKCTFNFKNFLPSGNADELAVLSFDIFPQDDKFAITNVNKT